IDFNREYLLEDINGNLLIKGISKWVIVDINTRKLARTDKIDFEGEYHNVSLYNDVDKIKIDIPNNKEFCFQYIVKNSDIDHNCHMNNARYASLVFDSINMSNNLISFFQIDHIKETKLNDKIDVYKFNSEGFTFNIAYSNDEVVFISKCKVEKYEK
ncbi:MAG: hypothetical protein ACRC5M_01745, partial [Anaeroplasmataceae bacterium]